MTTMNKKRMYLNLKEIIDILNYYDNLPQVSKCNVAVELKISQQNFDTKSLTIRKF